MMSLEFWHAIVPTHQMIKVYVGIIKRGSARFSFSCRILLLQIWAEKLASLDPNHVLLMIS